MDDVYLEFIPHGHSVKVCAVCAKTGLEVAVVGPASAGQEQLSRLAVRKLNYVRGRRGASRASGEQSRPARPGLVI